ncbi:MAG: hypothetical protein K2H01_11020 [Ruminococcus sp.]|nr:hypothetical protein [Ruminococcus sp.]
MGNISTEDVKGILGEAFYQCCHSFFADLLCSQSDYKIIMTRRCFSLYKIFSRILINEGLKNKEGTTIITDKAIALHADKIREAVHKSIESDYGHAAVYIADDIIVFGRTISSVADEIFSLLQNDDDCANYTEHLAIRSIVMSSDASKMKDIYKGIPVANIIETGSMLRTYSNLISDLISSTGVANTSYVVSSFIPVKLDRDSDSFKLYNASIGENFGDVIESASLRCYTRSGFRIIIPLVVIADATGAAISSLIQWLQSGFGEFPQSTKALLTSEEPRLFQSKLQYISLLFSSVLLFCYLRENQIPFDINDTDYKETIGLNFSSELQNEFKELEKKFDKIPDIFSGFAECNYVNSYQLEDAVFARSVADNVSDSITAVCREDICGSSFYSDSFLPTLFRLVDSGKATLKACYDQVNKRYTTMLYAGEQAFRIAQQPFASILPFLSCVESSIPDCLSLEEKKSTYDSIISSLEAGSILTSDESKRLKNFARILIDCRESFSDICVISKDSAASIDEAYLKELTSTIQKEPVLWG